MQQPVDIKGIARLREDNWFEDQDAAMYAIVAMVGIDVYHALPNRHDHIDYIQHVIAHETATSSKLKAFNSPEGVAKFKNELRHYIAPFREQAIEAIIGGKLKDYERDYLRDPEAVNGTLASILRQAAHPILPMAERGVLISTLRTACGNVPNNEKEKFQDRVRQAVSLARQDEQGVNNLKSAVAAAIARTSLDAEAQEKLIETCDSIITHTLDDIKQDRSIHIAPDFADELALLLQDQDKLYKLKAQQVIQGHAFSKAHEESTHEFGKPPVALAHMPMEHHEALLKAATAAIQSMKTPKNNILGNELSMLGGVTPNHGKSVA